MRRCVLILLALLVLAVQRGQSQWMPMLEAGYVVPHGALVPVDHLTSNGQVTAQFGQGWQVGALFRRSSAGASMVLGLRLGQLQQRSGVVYDTMSYSPSSFMREQAAYDGVISADRVFAAIPLQLWLTLGGRSHLVFGMEGSFALTSTVEERGERIMITTHYVPPTQVVSYIDVREGSYARALSSKAQDALHLSLGAGYRHRLGERWYLGADASVVATTAAAPDISGQVWKAVFSLAWTM